MAKYIFEELVIGTKNPAKVERFQKLLKNVAKKVSGVLDFNIDSKPKETGKTSEENAEIKTKYYSKLTNLPVFAEDEALYVNFLPKDKQPGVNVRRIEGIEEATDDELFQYWENIIKNIPEKERIGHWHISYCLGFPNGEIITIAKDHPIRFFYPTSGIRIPGWPMSSLEGPRNIGKPHSEMTDEETKRHRKEADMEILRIFKEFTKVSSVYSQ